MKISLNKRSFRSLFLLLILPLTVTLTSCEDDENEEMGGEAALTGTWTYESASIDLLVDGVPILDYFMDELGATEEEAEQFETIFEDNANFFEGINITFESDGTYSVDDDGMTETGTWSLNEDASEITFDAGTADATVLEVFTLTNSQLSFGLSEEDSEDLNDDDDPETLTIDLVINMTK